MRALFLLPLTAACGARTELSTPPDASASIADAGQDVGPVVDAGIAPDVAPQPAAELIASTSVPAYAITVDDENVYWTQGYWGSGSTFPSYPMVLQCDKKNCQTPIVLGNGNDVPLSIAVDEANVYWSSDSQWLLGLPSQTPSPGLFTCAIGGCAQTPQKIAEGLAHGVVTHAEQLFWVDGGAVADCVAGSCSSSTVMLAPAKGTLRTDGDYAYWSTDSAIMRCRLGATGCLSPPVVVVPDTPSSGGMLATYRTFTMDGANLYWISHGEVRSCPKDGCSSPITLMPDFDTFAQCIATDGVNVYWTAPNALVRCPVSGCAKPIRVYVDYEHTPDPNCLALDATNVYWTTGDITGYCEGPCGGGSIMTLPKP